MNDFHIQDAIVAMQRYFPRFFRNKYLLSYLLIREEEKWLLINIEPKNNLSSPNDNNTHTAIGGENQLMIPMIMN